jgi:hypothetical protein
MSEYDAEYEYDDAACADAPGRLVVIWDNDRRDAGHEWGPSTAAREPAAIRRERYLRAVGRSEA